MSMHVLAFDSSINSATLTQQNGVADQIVPASSNGYQVPGQLNKVGCVWSQGTTLVRTQLQSPALRNQPFPIFQPVNVGAQSMSPVRAAYLWNAPLVLNPFDELDSFANNAAGGAVHLRSFVILFDTPPVPVNGPFLRVYWSSTTAVTAGAWSAIPITLFSSLTVGNYAIVGATAFSATGLAFRVIPSSPGTVFRPGGNMGVANSDMMLTGQDNGGWGTWLTFNSLTPPQLELFCIANDASYYGELILLPM